MDIHAFVDGQRVERVPADQTVHLVSEGLANHGLPEIEIVGVVPDTVYFGVLLMTAAADHFVNEAPPSDGAVFSMNFKGSAVRMRGYRSESHGQTVVRLVDAVETKLTMAAPLTALERVSFNLPNPIDAFVKSANGPSRKTLASMIPNSPTP